MVSDRIHPMTSVLFRLSRFLCVIAVVSVCASFLHAQGTTASIQGTVKDGTGGALANATVVITNVGTNLERAVSSDGSGFFVVPDLRPGTYRMRVSSAGFQTSVQEGIALVVGQKAVLNATLQLGRSSDQVTVTAESLTVDNTVEQISGLIGGQQVKDLPLNGRSFDNLITLNPATVNTTAHSTHRDQSVHAIVITGTTAS
jgi:hypothetical protein